MRDGVKKCSAIIFPSFSIHLYILKNRKIQKYRYKKNTFKNHFNYISFPRKEMSGNFCFNSEKNEKYYAFSALFNGS